MFDRVRKMPLDLEDVFIQHFLKHWIRDLVTYFKASQRGVKENLDCGFVKEEKVQSIRTNGLISLRTKGLYSKFFWSVFSCVQDRKSWNTYTFYAVLTTTKFFSSFINLEEALPLHITKTTFYLSITFPFPIPCIAALFPFKIFKKFSDVTFCINKENFSCVADLVS